MGVVRNPWSISRSDIVCLEGNGARPSHKGCGYSMNGEAMFTLNKTEVHAVCYSIGAYNSEGWLSDNPKAGCHETNVARAIDSDPNPSRYQGGDCVVEIHKNYEDD